MQTQITIEAETYDEAVAAIAQWFKCSPEHMLENLTKVAVSIDENRRVWLQRVATEPNARLRPIERRQVWFRDRLTRAARFVARWWAAQDGIGAADMEALVTAAREYEGALGPRAGSLAPNSPDDGGLARDQPRVLFLQAANDADEMTFCPSDDESERAVTFHRGREQARRLSFEDVERLATWCADWLYWSRWVSPCTSCGGLTMTLRTNEASLEACEACDGTGRGTR